MSGALTSPPTPQPRPRSRWFWRGVLLVGLGALGAWGLLTRVPIYALATHPYLTVDPAIHFLVAPVAGPVSVTHLQVGREVQAGEVLVELDHTEQHLEVEEARHQLLALEAHRNARQQEGTALEAASHAATQEAQAALEAAQSRHHEAVVALQEAQTKTQRLGPFASLSALGPQQTAVDTARLALQRLETEQQVRSTAWGTRLAQFQREVVVLNGDRALATARLARLEHALAQRYLRAPVTGRLGAVARLQTRSFVQAGERLGVIASTEAPLVTATIAPMLPSRPLQPGQAAWLLSTGVSEAASQSLAARVLQTDAAGQDERQRVVLRLTPEALAYWPLHPNVMWTAMVEVEQLSPLTLALRVLRQRLSGHTRGSIPTVLSGKAPQP